MWDPSGVYADYYERALINHILASQNPETGMMCYYLPLRSGSKKQYNGFDDAFWCCTGTGVENHAKYGDSIYFHDDGSLYVNLFIASELVWKTKGLLVRQETQWPNEQATRLVLTSERPLELNLKLRHPAWAESGFQISLNGEPVAEASKPGSYAEIRRTWKSGDQVEIRFPFGLRSEGFRDNPSRLAFLHGPLVLCAPTEAKKLVPAVVSAAESLLGGLTPVPGRLSTFTGSADVFRLAADPKGGEVTLEPLFTVHGERHYIVYWDLFTPAQWRARLAKDAAPPAQPK
jgi:DUF1680 family protein